MLEMTNDGYYDLSSSDWEREMEWLGHVLDAELSGFIEDWI